MNLKTTCLLKHPHASMMEAQECNWHLARLNNQEIKAFKWQHNIDLHIAGKLWKKWAVDFMVTEKNGEQTFWETKGYNMSDDVFRMKLSAAMIEYPKAKFYVNKRLVTFTPKQRLRIK